jgi:hypothetical protein
MALHAFLTALVAVFILPFMLIGVASLIFPRYLLKAWVRIHRWFRLKLYRGGWVPEEHLFGRLAYWWIPKDVALRTPDDLYAYLLSDRYWRSWLRRISYLVGGVWFVLAALFVYAVLIAKPP